MTQNNQLRQQDYLFLKGGGEMGELTRSFDWSKTILGKPEDWPQSLKTTISIILNSKFPMFLFWGEDLICFYNDAYRPSLGKEGKHPSMLGMRAEDAWTEIWDAIKPLIDQVLAGGEATWSEDQLLPIYRNGRLEDVYWTFSYSPVMDESNIPAGVFVTCSETTGKVIAQQKLEANNQQLLSAMEAEALAQKKVKENERNLRLIILQAPVAIAIFRGPSYTVEMVNARALELWGKEHADVQDMPIIKAMPELESQGIKTLLDNVYQTGQSFSAFEWPVQLLRNGKLETAYVDFVYEPLYDSNENINGIITIGIEVTTQVLARKKIEESEKRFRTLAEGTNILIAVGDETSNAIYFNNAWTELTGRSVEDLLNFGWADLIHPDDKEEYVDIYLTAFKDRLPFSGEFRILNKNGEYHWLLALGPPRFNPDGSFAGYISSCIDITAHKQHQRELQASRQRLDQILSQIPTPIMVLTGAEQVIETANNAMLLFLKRRKEDITGRPLLEAFPELADQPYPALRKQVLETGITIKNLERPAFLTQKDGSKQLFYIDNYYQPLTEENGKITSVLATLIDVTDKVNSRKLIEDSKAELQAINEQLAATNEELSNANEELNESKVALEQLNDNLLQSQNELHFALHAAELATWHLNPVTNRFTGNSRLRSWFGLPQKGEIDLQQAISVIDSNDQPRVVTAIRQAMTFGLGDSYNIEYTIVHPVHKVSRIIKAKGKTLFNDEKQPIHFSGTLQDITEERLASAKLADTNQQLQFALDAGRLGSYDLNLLTGEMDCTPQCKANYGIDKDAVFNFSDLMQTIVTDYHDYVNEQLQTAISNHSIYNAEYQVQWPDKSLHWINVSGKPTYNKEGVAIRLVGISADITERKLDDLRKNDFIGMVSHELKTPLTSLSAFMQILNSKEKNNDAFTAGLLDKASVQIKKMSNLINGFLNISRFESGKIQIIKQDFSLSDLLTDMISETLLTVSSHTIYCTKNTPVTINADREKIGSVVSNLLSNAVKYSPQGKTITVSYEVVGGQVQVSVKDEGIGIKPEDQPKLFDRYYRVESNASKQISGFGIGLYLSAEIIYRHNGNIWVESESGQGSTFFFTLPLAV